jgi:CheY-like chemotaxis protein
MLSQHALIVDDSKTAQLRLKRMLEVYVLEVDVASSAEEALAYLSYRVPAVIFLDQSMQGMDGIEALRTIKANPNTATIPVIMYTSEKGNVFTTQARALGALDILNKSSLAPSGLDKMLSALKIPRRQKARVDTPTAVNKILGQENIGDTKKPDYVERSELNEIHRQIARLFEIHIADVARQITKSTQFLSKRLATFSDTSSKTPTEVVIGDVPLDVINKEVAAERHRIALVSNGLLVALLLMLMVMGGLLFNVYGRLSSISEDYDNAVALAEFNAAQVNQLTEEFYQSSRSPGQARAVNPQMLGTLTWIANVDFGFGMNEEPLGERMVSKLQRLVYQLSDMGYLGVVEININFGNACLSRTDSGQLVLAANDEPVFNCVLRTSLDEEFLVDNFLSLPYLSFEQSFPALQNKTIALAVNRIGLNNPRVEYPFISDTTTAGDWNRISLQNNYLSFDFHPFE